MLVMEVIVRIKTDKYDLPDVTKFIQGISTETMTLKVISSKIVGKEDNPKEQPKPKEQEKGKEPDKPEYPKADFFGL